MRWLLLLCAACVHHHAAMILAVESPAVPPRAQPTVDLRIEHPAAVYNHRDEETVDGVVRDHRLDQVAQDLAALPDPHHPPALELALRAHGVIEPASVVSLDQVDARASNARVGIAGNLAVVMHTAAVELPELPRAVDAGASVPLHGVLASWLHAPAVTVTYDDDADAVVHPVLWKTDRYAFDTTLECGAHRGAMWILIEGSEDDGEQVRGLALFPIACGVAAENAYRIEPTLPAGDPVAQLAAVVDRERARLGLRPLAGDLRATRAAQAQVALHSVKHGDSAKRMRDAGLIPLNLLEATLHAPTVTAAAEILLNTPGYRELLAHPELTHVGIAVARDAHGELFVAIELVQLVDPVDTRRMEQQLFARISDKLGARERPIEKTNTTLDHLAAHYTALRAAGWSDPSAYFGFTDDGDLDFGPFKNLHRVIALQLDADTSKLDLDIPRRLDAVGISVRQSPRNGPLAGRVWLIILYAQSRTW